MVRSRTKWFIWGIVGVAVGLYSGAIFPQTQTLALKNTLISLNIDNPSADVEKNTTNEDYRFIGICGYTCYAPGLTALEEKLTRKYGVKNLKGTSDAIESADHKQLIEVARKYAENYNRALLQKLKALPN